MKLLVLCLANPVKPFVQPQTMNSLFNLEWSQPFDLVIAREDTNQVPDLTGKLLSITAKANRGRDILLSGGYDAMLLVEADNILPPDTLKKLTKVDADICYGLYCQRPNRRHRWMMRIGEDIHVKEYPEKFMRQCWNKVVPSDGLGFGCTLIHRRVLEAIQFNCKAELGPDYHMAKAARAAGFKQATDCSVHVGHIIGPYEAVWPDPERTFRIRKI